MKNIKRLLSLFLIAIIAITLFAGCNNNDNDPTGSQPTADPQTSNTPTDPSTSAPIFNYSDSIDENGFWEDVTALDHVELSEYIGIQVPSEIHTVPDEYVQMEIDAILAEYKQQITDRAVVDGDTINMDFVGSIDGVEFNGGNTNGAGEEVTIGVTEYIDDFLEQIIGHTPGESFDIEVTFPEDYGEENLNGKDAIFAVTLNYIAELPVMTDQFVAEKLSAEYGWNTVDAMESDVKTKMQEQAMLNYIQEYLVENITVNTVPESLLTYQQNQMIQYFEENATLYEMEFDEFLSTYIEVSSVDELIELYREDNTQMAEMYLILQAIAEDADISITHEDVVDYFSKYMGTEDYSEYEESFGIPYIKLSVLNEEVMIHLQKNATLQ
ncbi:MAG: hypothetical protein GX815_09920 [Clostridiales bacterium]|nr:hypothetical protein [Clostridiales bacterium]